MSKKIFTKADIENFKENFRTSLSERISELTDGHPNDVRVDLYKVLTDSIDSGVGDFELRQYISNRIKFLAIGHIPEGFPVPEVSVRIVTTELYEGSDSYKVSITVASNKNSVVRGTHEQAKFTLSPTNGKEVFVKVFTFLADVFGTLVVATAGVVNLAAVNDVYRLANSEEFANNSYDIEFIPSTSATRPILESISDDRVVFVIPEDVVFGVVPNTPVFMGAHELPEEDEVSKEDMVEYLLLKQHNTKAQSDFDAIVDCLTNSATPVALLASKDVRLKGIIGMRSHKVHTLIRNTFNKNIEGVNEHPVKATVARVETDEIIGAVKYTPAKDSDVDGAKGEWSVYLSPVTKKGSASADVDLLALAKSKIAK